MTADEIAALRWYVIRRMKHGFDIVDANGDLVTEDTSGLGAFSFEEDARIASASPALFAALRDLLRWGEIDPSPIPPALLEAARAALAEALRADTADGPNQGDEPCL